MADVDPKRPLHQRLIEGALMALVSGAIFTGVVSAGGLLFKEIYEVISKTQSIEQKLDSIERKVDAIDEIKARNQAIADETALALAQLASTLSDLSGNVGELNAYKNVVIRDIELFQMQLSGVIDGYVSVEDFIYEGPTPVTTMTAPSPLAGGALPPDAPEEALFQEKQPPIIDFDPEMFQQRIQEKALSLPEDNRIETGG
jgi:hypothetical protein